mmetsp:Transcript_35091/g.104718  ORF Transcript_35091/g.104718 Transcript_35091/m.104718 type:complete len:275 (-) Transcript_35091:981-1805(-)
MITQKNQDDVVLIFSLEPRYLSCYSSAGNVNSALVVLRSLCLPRDRLHRVHSLDVSTSLCSFSLSPLLSSSSFPPSLCSSSVSPSLFPSFFSTLMFSPFPSASPSSSFVGSLSLILDPTMPHLRRSSTTRSFRLARWSTTYLLSSLSAMSMASVEQSPPAACGFATPSPRPGSSPENPRGYLAHTSSIFSRTPDLGGNHASTDLRKSGWSLPTSRSYTFFHPGSHNTHLGLIGNVNPSSIFRQSSSLSSGSETYFQGTFPGRVSEMTRNWSSIS